MAYIVLRRSRNTRSYYLVESYRDEAGRPRQRTLCYLGREQDGTDSLAKALAHWGRVEGDAAAELRKARGERRRILRDRRADAAARIRILREFVERAERAERAERERRRQAEEAEHWLAIERLGRAPSSEHAQAAKRAFRVLALRLHPDQGGSHHAFLRLKDAYDRALDGWRRAAGTGLRAG